jgi:uncharacterized protein (TIGR03083 family)
MHPLEPFVEAWRGTTRDVLDLLPTLSDDDWARPTDCPGWSVHDVVAHLAHLESVLAGLEEDDWPRGDAVPPSSYTQAGVDARRDHSPAELADELERAVGIRSDALTELPDPDGKPPKTPGDAPWSWQTLLSNRSIDCWVHEQDVRRAVGRPGSLDSGGAQVTTRSFAAGMPFVLGKRVKPPAGTSVVWTLTGGVPLEVGAVMGDDGRASGDVAAHPTTRLVLTSEAFTVLGAGRRGPEAVDVRIEGDEELGREVLRGMALTR